MNISRNLLFNRDFNNLIKIIGVLIGSISCSFYAINNFNLNKIYFNDLILLFLILFFIISLNFYNLKNSSKNKIYFLNNKVSSFFIIYIEFFRFLSGSCHYILIMYDEVSFKKEYNILKYFYIFSGCFFTYIFFGYFIVVLFIDMVKDYKTIIYLLYLTSILIIIKFYFIKNKKTKNEINNFKKSIIYKYKIIEDKFEEIVFTFENKEDLVRIEIDQIYINFKSGILYFTDNINNRIINVSYSSAKDYQISNGNKKLSDLNLSDIKVIEMLSI